MFAARIELIEGAIDKMVWLMSSPNMHCTKATAVVNDQMIYIVAIISFLIDNNPDNLKQIIHDLFPFLLFDVRQHNYTCLSASHGRNIMIGDSLFSVKAFLEFKTVR